MSFRTVTQKSKFDSHNNYSDLTKQMHEFRLRGKDMDLKRINILLKVIVG